MIIEGGSPESELEYTPAGRVLAEYHDRPEFVRVLVGPLGSAKTTSSIVEVVRMWSRAPVDPADNIRRSRGAAVRNTYPDLETTTIRDFLEVVEPLGIGQMTYGQPPRWSGEFQAADGITTRAEVFFLSFDLPKHTKKARGLRLSYAWFNEMKELHKDNIDMVLSRVGRFRPDLYRKYPHLRYCAIGDSNAPEPDHWLGEYMQDPPRGWWIGRQPPAVLRVDGRWVPNPNAENINNLAPGYYENMIPGKADSWIRQNLANELVYHRSGRPVHPDFVESMHVLPDNMAATAGQPLHLGFDFGRTPACAILQRRKKGNVVVLDEIVDTNTSAKPFGRKVLRFLEENYPGFEYEATGDPAGEAEGQAIDLDCFTALSECGPGGMTGIDAQPAQTNKFSIRVEALDCLLRELINGRPGIQINPRCKVLRAGLAGAYQYKRVQVVGDDRYHDKPVKSPESHIVEALHYGLMGLGSGHATISAARSEQFRAIERQYGGWHPPHTHFE